MSPTSGDLETPAAGPHRPSPFPINRCHQRVVTLVCRFKPFWVLSFPINRCHQRVVTAAPERACAASDPRAVCAPPHLVGAWGGLSSLWKTLKSIAPQGRAANGANTGVFGESRGGARILKRAKRQWPQGTFPRAGVAHPPVPSACALGQCWLELAGRRGGRETSGHQITLSRQAIGATGRPS